MITMAPRHGWLECIAGCMFAGKSSEMIRRLTLCTYARQKVVAVKPQVDVRNNGALSTHSGTRFPCVYAHSAKDIPEYVADADVVGIDEVQFFGPEIVSVCLSLARAGKRVIVAGLDLDYQGQPFGQMPLLLAVSPLVTKVHAVCTICGDVASRTQRVVDSEDTIVVGGAESYEARCWAHWEPVPVFSR